MLNYCIFFRFWFYVWKLAWWQFGIWARYEINDRIYRDYGWTLWGTAISHFYETLCASILGGKLLLKFIFSEKATKFATIFHFSLHTVKKIGRFCQMFEGMLWGTTILHVYETLHYKFRMFFLVSYNFFINRISHANKWMRKKNTCLQ